MRAGGGVRLIIDGTPLIERWRDAPPTEYTATVAMERGGRYKLELEYFNQAADALLELRWSSPSTAPALIPQARLYSRPAAALDQARTAYMRLGKLATLGERLLARRR